MLLPAGHGSAMPPVSRGRAAAADLAAAAQCGAQPARHPEPELHKNSRRGADREGDRSRPLPTASSRCRGLQVEVTQRLPKRARCAWATRAGLRHNRVLKGLCHHDKAESASK